MSLRSLLLPRCACAGWASTPTWSPRAQPLVAIHAGSPGELAYALDYATAQSESVHVSEDA